ncbi:MAG TPA: copper resistance protein NlpE [Agriterribacter sp.]|nr:copper resistance protein NlpE [Agriterribacter sp.]HRQ50437.1 copper resistance protein NlpE [Agriterribacter sp.]
MEKILLPACVLLLLIACNNHPGTIPSSMPDIDSALAIKTQVPGDPDATRTLVGVFEGILPCADCEGIRMELTLYQDLANADNNSYILKETYLGVNTGDTTFTSNGKWDIVKGIKADSEAAVYFLNYDRPDEPKYFLKQGDTTIVMLDKEQNQISTPLNYALRKR